ncbi:MAG: GNAT family N-acetyltransferase [Actinomycetota bacterium]|nr:GNAT family N-acetyltransferase [Actinomycetota bacterium]
MSRPPYPIETDRLTIRPFTGDDLDALHGIQSKRELTTYLYWEPRSRNEVVEVLDSRIDRPFDEVYRTGLALAVVVRDTNTLIGDVSLTVLSREHAQGEIGFVLDPDQQGRGYGREAATVLLRFGFEDLELHRIIGRCDPRNVPSWRLLERLGMRREAHFRESEIFKGEWGDEYVYALLAADWRGAATG